MAFADANLAVDLEVLDSFDFGGGEQGESWEDAGAAYEVPLADWGGGELRAAFDFGGVTAYVEDQLKGSSTSLYADYQRLTDRHLLALVLRHTGGNLSGASRALGITRATLRAKLAALGLKADRPPAAGEDTGHATPPGE